METFKAQTPAEEYGVGITRRSGVISNGKPAAELTFEFWCF